MGARTRGLANNVLSSGKLDATDAISGTIAAANIANDSLNNATTFGSVTSGVPTVASDPPSPAEGDIWYNTTTGALRFRAQSGAWSTGGNLNTARMALGGAGTQTAALVFGGGLPSPFKNETESYNGSTWTEVNNMNTTRTALEGAGSQTAALGFGGYSTPYTGATESWNGTSWTTLPATLNTARGNMGGGGIQTSAMCFGGIAGPPAGTPIEAKTELWDGSTWTEVNDLNTARYYLTSSTQDSGNTASLAFGGANGPKLAVTESWNGTSWTEVADLNTARDNLFGGGIATSAIGSGGVAAGSPTRLTITETWNGTSWSEDGDLNTARNQGTGAGANSSTALAVGGELQTGSPAATGATEEWSYADTTFTVG